MTYVRLISIYDPYIIIDMDKIEKNVEKTLDIVSENVMNIRKLRGVSQLQLALDIGMKGNAFIARAEKRTNGAHFNLEQLVKIADALNVDICRFFQKNQFDLN